MAYPNPGHSFDIALTLLLYLPTTTQPSASVFSKGLGKN